MKEKKLTSDQRKRIEAIKEEWLKELQKIPEPELTRWPDISLNKPYRELEKKYMLQINAIMEENNGEG